ncbi:MAG: 16S rRNA (cytosine(967)-C(5))-methyltransferase RsmB [Comamonas sp.]
MSEPLPLPLWRQLQAAAQVLQLVRQGHSMNDALAQVHDVPRPGVQALAFDALRRWGLAQALRAQLAPRAPVARADALLCLALALLVPQPAAAYADHTVVNQATEAAKRSPAMRHQAGFINACLRRFLREREALLAVAQQGTQARWNHPDWWIERLRRDHPDAWQSIARQNLARAAMTLRVNPRRASLAQYQDRLAEAGLPARQVGPHALALEMPVPVQALPGFDQGWVAVQDAAAQLAAPLLLDGLTAAPGQPLRLLDACAAPGGKTAHLLELADAEVLALEIDAVRARRIDENLARLGLAAEVRIADAADVDHWWDGRLFDGILLDAPCSASGIVRRHPDIPWLRRASDIGALAALQQRLLERLWPLVRPGGRLLFCTCSVFKAEGDDRIAAFLARNSDAKRLSAPGHLLPHGGSDADDMPDNASREHDGFYYARLEKIGA